ELDRGRDVGGGDLRRSFDVGRLVWIRRIGGNAVAQHEVGRLGLGRGAIKTEERGEPNAKRNRNDARCDPHEDNHGLAPATWTEAFILGMVGQRTPTRTFSAQSGVAYICDREAVDVR